MITKLKTIAILSENIALASILEMVIADNKNYRVRVFNNEIALANYMKITQIDLLIIDSEQIDFELISTISLLQNSALSSEFNFRIIALCKRVNKGARALCKTAKINEVIIKPMSPNYLETRVWALLNNKKHVNLAQEYNQNKQQRNKDNNHSQITGDNVIALFGKKSPNDPYSHIE